MEQKRNSTVKTRLTCAILFIVFTYLYLRCYQAEVLAAAQHELSGGLTSYNYTLYPVLTTLVLYLLHIGVYALVRVKKTFHALTYFPSFLLLVYITDVPCNLSQCHTMGVWAWLMPLLLLLYAGGIWVIRQLEPYETEGYSGFWMSRRTWLNLLQMLVMIMLLALAANGDSVFHQRARMERLMMEGRYADALQVGQGTLQTDSSLTMLRVACLHKTGQMGDRLFTYPLVGGSKAMIPDSVTTKTLMWTTPKWMHPMKNGKLRYIPPKDYRLCALLMDKNLDKFAVEVQKYYRVASDSMPIHYKEALMLYTHRRAHPKVVYRNAVMGTDFQDFQALERKYANPQERHAAIRDTYGNTYWYYYEYGSK